MHITVDMRASLSSSSSSSSSPSLLDLLVVEVSPPEYQGIVVLNTDLAVDFMPAADVAFKANSQSAPLPNLSDSAFGDSSSLDSGFGSSGSLSAATSFGSSNLSSASQLASSIVKQINGQLAQGAPAHELVLGLPVNGNRRLRHFMSNRFRFGSSFFHLSLFRNFAVRSISAFCVSTRPQHCRSSGADSVGFNSASLVVIIIIIIPRATTQPSTGSFSNRFV
jgi:hypothetical protein